MKRLIQKNHHSLKDIGSFIRKEYRNVRFIFEIDFSRDDYLEIKKLFQQESKLQNTNFKNNFFLEYFNGNNYRILFLILLAGFVRYEYLNDENKANFFDNFLKNVLHNHDAIDINFRKSLIDYFFRWRGKREYEEVGLYIYDVQTSDASLKLENSGKNKYLNSFIFHSGGISEQDLKEYLKVIKYLSENDARKNNLYKIFLKKEFNIYSNKINNIFSLLETDSEISRYLNDFIMQSVETIQGQNKSYSFYLPLYVKNYLLFSGKYGESIEKIIINDSDFIYENQSIVFNPRFHDIYRNVDQVTFVIESNRVDVPKEYDAYSDNDFLGIKIPIENIEKLFVIELMIDENIFKRYDIDLLDKGFLLLDSDYCIKGIHSREIDIPKKDENEKYYIVTKENLDLKLSDKKIDKYFVYEIFLDTNNIDISIGGKDYSLHYQPTILNDIQYEDSEGYLYVGEMPTFKLSSKDKMSFQANDLLSNRTLDYEQLSQYVEPIGKFYIQTKSKVFKLIYIAGFEITRWFNWYDKDKEISIHLSSEKIKTNSSEVERIDNYYLHTFNLKEQDNTLVFNQINGNNVQIKILKPTVRISFLDKRKNETNILSKNIKFERLTSFRQLKIQLINYPSKIKFDTVKIGEYDIDAIKHNDSYFISLAKIKELADLCDKAQVSISLKAKYYYLPITDIIFEGRSKNNRKNIKEIMINDIHFLMNNSENIKYYFKNKAYFINGFEFDQKYGTKMLVLKEVRQTKKSSIIKRNFRNIKEEGLFVALKDIDYE